MNEKNTKLLYTTFPKLYRGKDRTIQESLMPFGFMCSDGWYNLIYSLSKKITKLDPEVEAVEVKEKFGGLRFYINASCRKVFDAIDEAEEKSYNTCEECGKVGKLRDDLAWYLTLCNNCYKKYEPKNKIKKFGEKYGKKKK